MYMNDYIMFMDVSWRRNLHGCWWEITLSKNVTILEDHGLSRRGEGRNATEAIGRAARGAVASVARVRPDADEFGVGVLQVWKNTSKNWIRTLKYCGRCTIYIHIYDYNVYIYI